MSDKRIDVSEASLNRLLDSKDDRIRALEARVAELEAGLRPFANFVFEPNWMVHRILADENDDVCVVCGYDAIGNTTGVDVNWSDFQHARALLAQREPTNKEGT